MADDALLVVKIEESSQTAGAPPRPPEPLNVPVIAPDPVQNTPQGTSRYAEMFSRVQAGQPPTDEPRPSIAAQIVADANRQGLIKTVDDIQAFAEMAVRTVQDAIAAGADLNKLMTQRYDELAAQVRERSTPPPEVSPSATTPTAETAARIERPSASVPSFDAEAEARRRMELERVRKEQEEAIDAARRRMDAEYNQKRQEQEDARLPRVQATPETQARLIIEREKETATQREAVHAARMELDPDYARRIMGQQTMQQANQVARGLAVSGQGQAAGMVAEAGGFAAGATGPLGLIIMAVEKTKEEIEAHWQSMRQAIETSARFGTSVMRSDPEALARNMTDVTAKLPIFGDHLATASRGIMDFYDAANTRARELARYNGQLAGLVAQRDNQQIMREVNRANEFGPQLANVFDARSNVQDRLNSLVDRFTPMALRTAENLLRVMERVLELVERGVITMAEGFDAIISAIPPPLQNLEVIQDIRATLDELRRELNQNLGTDPMQDFLEQDWGNAAQNILPPQGQNPAPLAGGI